MSKSRQLFHGIRHPRSRIFPVLSNTSPKNHSLKKRPRFLQRQCRRGERTISTGGSKNWQSPPRRRRAMLQSLRIYLDRSPLLQRRTGPAVLKYDNILLVYLDKVYVSFPRSHGGCIGAVIKGNKHCALNSLTTIDWSGGNENIPFRRICAVGILQNSVRERHNSPPTNIITMVRHLRHDLKRGFNGSPRSNAWAAIRRGWPRALWLGLVKFHKIMKFPLI